MKWLGGAGAATEPFCHLAYLWAEHGGTAALGETSGLLLLLLFHHGGEKREGKRGKERGKVARFTLLSVECARLTPAPIMRNDNGRKSVIRNLRLAAIIT